MNKETTVASVEFFFKSNPEKAVEYEIYCDSKKRLEEIIDEGFKRGYIYCMVNWMGPKYVVYINTAELEMVHFRL